MNYRYLQSLSKSDAAYLWYMGQIQGDVTPVSMATVAGVEADTAKTNLDELVDKNFATRTETTGGALRDIYTRTDKGRPVS